MSSSSSSKPTPANRPVRQRKNVQLYSDDNPQTFTVKKKGAATTQQKRSKPGRPPRSPSPEKMELPNNKRRFRDITPAPIRFLSQDTSLPHKVTVQPILPLTVATTTPSSSSSSLSVSAAAATYSSDAFLEPSVPQRLDSPPITSVYHQNNTLLVLGDAVGGLALWRLQPKCQCSAYRPGQGGIFTRTKAHYPHAILACCAAAVVVVVEESTNNNAAAAVVIIAIQATQLLVWDPIRNTCQSRELVAAGTSNNNIQLESQNSRVLWTTGQGPVPDSKAKQELSGLFVFHIDCVEKCDAVVIHGVRGNCVTAIWDSQDMLMVVYDVTARLLRCRDGTVQQETVVPSTKRAQWDFHLQKAGSEFILLNTARGIRLYDDSLNCLQVYGDSVSLHGSTVAWRQSLWLPQPSFPCEHVLQYKKQMWVERPDELAWREQGRSAECLLVGVPEALRQPHELQSTLHVWKPGQATVMATLQAPPGGLLGVVILNESNGWRIICVTAEFGQVWEWRAAFRSDFAGVQYPVGYQVIRDNIEYIEDEDELDRIVVLEDGREVISPPQSDQTGKLLQANEPAPTDPEFDEAMRLSLLEHVNEQAGAHNEEPQCLISVLVEDDEKSYGSLVIPCRPEVARDPEGETEDELTVRSPGAADPLNKVNSEFEFLTALPQFKKVRAEIRMREHHHLYLVREESIVSDVSSVAGTQKPKGKRTRIPNIEAVLQASVDPSLRARMSQLSGQWADGTGSSLRPQELHHLSTLPVISKVDTSSSATIEPQSDASTKNDKSVEVKLVAESTMEKSAQNGAFHMNTGRQLWNSSALPLNDIERCSPSIASKASAEEKELAMELLLLSPTKNATCPTIANEGSDREAAKSKAQNDRSSADDVLAPDATITPSEPSPAEMPFATLNSQDKPFLASRAVNAPCPACYGRMVIHKCGIRELPVDYEAVARAERERKEREEAEKQRIRAEKRKIAEAKRKEARRKRKEEEVRKIKEEEMHSQQLDVHRFDHARIREDMVHGVQQSIWSSASLVHQPAFSPVTKAQLDDCSAHVRPMPPPSQFAEENHQEGEYKVRTLEPAASTMETEAWRERTVYNYSAHPEGHDRHSHSYEQFHPETSQATESDHVVLHHAAEYKSSVSPDQTITVDGTMMRPSTTLSTEDALVALAGLATVAVQSSDRISQVASHHGDFEYADRGITANGTKYHDRSDENRSADDQNGGVSPETIVYSEPSDGCNAQNGTMQSCNGGKRCTDDEEPVTYSTQATEHSGIEHRTTVETKLFESGSSSEEIERVKVDIAANDR